MEPGETIGETIVREVREETGIEATGEKLLGVYSNPRHVYVYDHRECRAVGGEPRNRDYWRYTEELESLRRGLERRSRHA
jgi:ADP-ribose pyrophosphatase YjhB (NUDIX family)